MDNTYLSGYVNGMIGSVDSISRSMLNKKTLDVTSMVGSDGKGTFDFSGFGKNDTIYIDGDSISSQIKTGNDAFQIIKKPGQTIVFNFKTTPTIEVNQFNYKFVGESSWSNTAPSTSNDGTNNRLEKIAKTIVFNAPGKTIKPTNAAGLFLATGEGGKDVLGNGTASGWIVANEFSRTNGHEWHGI